MAVLHLDNLSIKMNSEKTGRGRRRLGSRQRLQLQLQKPAVDSSALQANMLNQNKPYREQIVSRITKTISRVVKKTESILEPTTPEPETVDAVETPTPEVQTEQLETTTGDSIESIDQGNPITVSKNVFKQIVTQTPKKREGRRRRSRHDDSGVVVNQR